MRSRCEFCRKRKFGVVERCVTTSPGSGRVFHICTKCLTAGRLPKSFEERMGISGQLKEGAKFVRFVGTPYITSSEHGQNAFGSILAEFDGALLGVICGHGGSAWLCLECAEKALAKQRVPKAAPPLTG